MKKIMILLLALAVLFSFAACDNNSNEPSGEEETPGTETGYAPADITTAVELMLGEAGSNEDGQALPGLEDSIRQLLGATYEDSDWNDSADIIAEESSTYSVEITGLGANTANGSPVTIVATKRYAAANDTYPVESATLTVTAIKTSGAGTATDPYDVTFNDFTYGYNSYIKNAANDDTYKVSGSVKGYFVGSVTAEIAMDGAAVDTCAVTTTSMKVVLSGTAGDYALTFGESDDVTPANILDRVNRYARELSYNTYLNDATNGVVTKAEDGIETYVSALVANDSTSGVSKLFTTIKELIENETLTVNEDYTYTSTGAGSLHLEYTPATDDDELIADDEGAGSVTLKRTQTITIDIAGTGTATASGFTASTVTITAPSLAVEKATGVTGFDEIAVTGLTVKVNSTDDAAQISVDNGVPNLSELKFSTEADAITAGTVTADVTLGPAIEWDADAAATALVVDDVPVDYAD